MPKKHDFSQHESTAIVAAIEALLEARGETWAWLSRQVGCNKSTLSRVKAGARVISKTSLKKIAEALEKPLTHFTLSANHAHTHFLIRALIKTHNLPFNIQDVKHYRELSEEAFDWGVLNKYEETQG